MIKRTSTGRLKHQRRDVSTRRPMHLTQRLRPGLPTLRRPEILALFRGLTREATKRGVRSCAYALLGNHLHWVCVAETREALADATRYVFAQLARRLNKLWQRRGRVFGDRFASVPGRSARQAWNALNYVLRNPVDARLAAPRGPLDRYLGADESLIGGHPFLRAVFGPAGPELRRLLHRMARAPVPFTPLTERQQPALPGL
jgi:hypothetical protein